VLAVVSEIVREGERRMLAEDAPRVNDRRVDLETGERQRFCSAILPSWVVRAGAKFDNGKLVERPETTAT
jgi:hypothetical protein